MGKMISSQELKHKSDYQNLEAEAVESGGKEEFKES